MKDSGCLPVPVDLLIKLTLLADLVCPVTEDELAAIEQGKALCGDRWPFPRPRDPENESRP